MEFYAHLFLKDLLVVKIYDECSMGQINWMNMHLTIFVAHRNLSGSHYCPDLTKLFLGQIPFEN